MRRDVAITTYLEDWDAGGSDGAGGGSRVLGVGFTATGQEGVISISFCRMDVCLLRLFGILFQPFFFFFHTLDAYVYT